MGREANRFSTSSASHPAVQILASTNVELSLAWDVTDGVGGIDGWLAGRVGGWREGGREERMILESINLKL